MPKHKPIKFEKSLDKNTIEEISEIMKNNKTAKTITNATLAIAAVGGILTFGAIAPNAIGGMIKMYKNYKKNQKDKYNQIWRSFNKLKNQQILEFVREDDDSLVYKISKKGKNKMRKFVLDELFIEVPEKWDGKWRLITFDIPERKAKARRSLSSKLKEMGFCQCQKSIWVHPFTCIKEIEFLMDIYEIKPFVKIFTTNEMPDGKTLYYFGNLLKQLITK